MTSLPLPEVVAAPIVSTAPFLIGTPEEVPIMRLQPNQVPENLVHKLPNLP